MGYAAHHRDFGSFVSHNAPLAKRPGFLRRMFDAFMDSRQREVDRQIARFLAARSVETLTDDLERELSHRLTTSNWSVNVSPFADKRFP